MKKRYKIISSCDNNGTICNLAGVNLKWSMKASIHILDRIEIC